MMTDCFEVLRRQVLNFHISGSVRRKKALGKMFCCLSSLFETKFILTCQT